MHLNNVWFLIDALFWIGFFILEGFDFGVGMLHAFVGQNDTERRIAINAIGPLWDGNEVWLIVAGAVIFAAFPAWYATMFSTFYLALVVLLVALILRGVSFEYMRKVRDPRWYAAWKWCLTIGSLLIPLLVGTALGDMLHGLPIDRAGNYTGNFFGLLLPFGLFTGITFTVLCLLLGATFLSLKTTGALHERVAHLSGRIGWVAAVVVWGFVTWAHIGLGRGFVPNPLDVLAVMAVIASAWLAWEHQEGWAFTTAVLAMAATVGSIFFDLFPRVFVSTISSAYTLTVANTASPSYTLKVMTVVALIFFPVVLAYQAWNIWVFRARLTSPPASAEGPVATGTPGGVASGAESAPAVAGPDQ